jgi:hypothetical protein
VGLRQSGRPLHAARALEELLDESRGALSIEERAHVREEIARTYAELAEIRVRTETIGPTEIRVDGEAAGAASDRALVIHALAGAHTIEAISESRTCASQRVSATAGETTEIVFDSAGCRVHAGAESGEDDDSWIWIVSLSVAGVLLAGGAVALAVWLGNREGELVTDPINGIEFVLRY